MIRVAQKATEAGDGPKFTEVMDPTADSVKELGRCAQVQQWGWMQVAGPIMSA